MLGAKYLAHLQQTVDTCFQKLKSVIKKKKTESLILSLLISFEG